jgi:hypothetical protein
MYLDAPVYIYGASSVYIWPMSQVGGVYVPGLSWQEECSAQLVAVQSGGAAGAPLPVRTHTVRIWRILQGGESFTPGFPLLTQALSSQFRRGVDRTCALLRN